MVLGKGAESSLIQAVIFNLDGVLVSTHQCHYDAWKQLALEQGIPFTDDIYRRMEGMKRMDSLEVLLERAEREYSLGEKWALSARKNDLFNESVARLKASSILPGTVETLYALREMGVKTAVASSSENATGILRQLQLDSLLDAIVDGTQIQQGKPDPEAFLLAARKLRAPTAQCLVVENSEAGIVAAREAGMEIARLGRLSGRQFSTLADLQLPLRVAE